MKIISSDENFEKEISSTDKFVLVDFFATWCGPCSVLGPILEKLNKHFEEKIIFMKADTDNVPATAQKFGVEKIPTVVLLKNGKPVSGFVGLIPELAIKEWLEKTMKENESPAPADDKNKKAEEMIKNFEKHAEENGFKLNPDKKTVERIINGLLENEKKYGKQYCPCRRVTGNEEEDAKKICPCFWHKDEIKKDGHCFCRLYVK